VTSTAPDFGFLVADSTGPTITAQSPIAGVGGVHPSFAIELTFSEDIQAGSGPVVISNSNQGGLERYIDIHDAERVSIVGNKLTVQPKFWFKAGTISVTMAAGVVTDDPHAGSGASNPGQAVNSGEYTFSVQGISPMTTTHYLEVGLAPGGGGCSYSMTHPWYTCGDFSECTIFVKPAGTGCGSGGSRQYKKITMKALQKIADLGLKRNGGDGRDSILNYGGGQIWPDDVVVGFSE